MTIRPGARDDVPAVLRLLDDAVTWLVANGRTGQWGTRPASANPRRHEQLTEFADEGGLWIADRDGEPVGALSVGAALEYVPAADEPELYVRLLVTDRAAKGLGIGTELLDHARKLARAQGLHLLRVDCYAGDDQALVRYYERQGFTRDRPFEVDGWPGQLLIERV